MSIAQLKAEVDRLSLEDRRQLRAYLMLKDQISDEAFLAGVSAQIDDRRPEHWLSIEEFEQRVES